MGTNSLTRSRKVVEVLNRFSQCNNYDAVEEYETELAATISERETSTPDGLLRKPGLVTWCAWDNYDENMETLSGAGTLHLLMVSWLGSITTDAKDYIYCWPMPCTYYILKASWLKMVHYLKLS